MEMESPKPCQEHEQHIFGDWKTYTFHPAAATDDDCFRVMHHVGEHFIPQEPMHKCLTGGVWDSNLEADITAEVKHVLKDGLSFYVTLKNSDEMVAVQLISDSRNPACFELRSEETRIISRVLGKIKEAVHPKFQTATQNCNHYADFCMTSVDSKHQGQGLATEMYERSLKLLTAKGYRAVRTDFSHAATQRIGEKLGFEVLHTFYLRDEYDEHGASIFPNASEEECVQHVVKILN